MTPLLSNLAARACLLRTALTRRFIWNDLAALARGYGMDYPDIRGSLGPLDLAARLPNFPVVLPPLASLGSPADFTPPGAPAHFHSEPSVSRFLCQLALALPARTIIELGCFTGWSTAHLALAANSTAARVWAVDPCREFLDAARANLRRLGLSPPVTWLQGASLDPAVLSQLPPTADLIFLDTSHAYPDTRDEILTHAPRLSPGGCLVLHDAISAPGVRRSLLEVSNRFPSHTFATEHGHGVAVLFAKSP